MVKNTKWLRQIIMTDTYGIGEENVMGCGYWSDDAFRKYSRNMGRTVDSNGKLKGNMTNQEMFKEKTLNPLLNPKDVMRTCCDNEEHPNTIPVILALDVTGSMGQAAVEVAKQLNIIMTELYRNVKDVEFMVMGIGDFAYDKHPLQVTQFESDIRIAEQLDKIYFEFGGGGNSYESYTAAWYFGLEHVNLDAWKRGRKGIIITMGDEGLNPYLPGNRLAGLTGRPVPCNVETRDLYPGVLQKYDVYHLFVDHGSYVLRDYYRSWREYLDEEHFMVTNIDGIKDKIVRIVTAHAEEDRRTVAFTEAKERRFGNFFEPNEKKAATFLQAAAKAEGISW
ncbi:MAG: VWA domain-containing protein [Lachnospiraceae bacterium]|nr:VWA domain-containing protein [Lachnospiraceae bacterium]